MRAPYRRAKKARPVAIVLVLLAHAVLVLLFLVGARFKRESPRPELVFLSLWPEIAAAPAIARPPPPSAFRTSPRASPAPPANPVVPPLSQPDAPDTAISEPAVSLRPNIDWRAEAAAVAGRHATPPPPAEFAPPPKTLRKACEKKKSSWEWKEKGYGIAPLPYVKLGKRCVIGLGFFGCALQKPPEANSHLLDDMRDGKTEASSVPDPETCD